MTALELSVLIAKLSPGCAKCRLPNLGIYGLSALNT